MCISNACTCRSYLIVASLRQTSTATIQMLLTSSGSAKMGTASSIVSGFCNVIGVGPDKGRIFAGEWLMLSHSSASRSARAHKRPRLQALRSAEAWKLSTRSPQSRIRPSKRLSIFGAFPSEKMANHIGAASPSMLSTELHRCPHLSLLASGRGRDTLHVIWLFNYFVLVLKVSLKLCTYPLQAAGLF